MDVVWISLEIAGLSAVLVGLYSLRQRIGLAPLYMAVGLLLAFMMLGSRLDLEVAVPGGRTISYTSLEHLTLVLASVVLVYALEGSREARRMIGAVALTNLGVFGLRSLLSLHLQRAGVDLDQLGRREWLDPSLDSALVSTASMAVAGLTIIVVYQALHNAARRLPVVVSLGAALVAAMVADSLVYGSFKGELDLVRIATHVSGKVTGALAAIVPVAAYIAWQFRRAGGAEALSHGVLERGVFDVLAMRRQMRSTQSELEQSRAELEHTKALFSRYVSPDVVTEILKDTSRVKLGGELREVTVLFADIRGYSTLSERLSPEETIELLNAYFGEMSEIIHFEHGTIIEFEGDAILAVFGAPLDQDDHAARAVRTALNMLRRVVRLNRRWDADGTSRKWRDLGIDSFKIRIGIHSGPVVVGNVGSVQRTKYAIIGDTVNTAHRVESLNKALGSTLLVSDATCAELQRTGQDALPLVDLGQHQVKGRAEPVHVYSLRDLLERDRREKARSPAERVPETA